MSARDPHGAGSAPVIDPRHTAHNPVIGWLQGFGALRLLLVGAVALLIAIGPFSGGRVVLDGAALITTLIAPVAYAVFLFVLPLDMVMTFIFMSDAEAGKRARLRRVLVTEAVLFVLLVLAWLPFVLTLLDRR